MPGFIVHQGATVLCTHGGTAQPLGVEPRVKVGGAPVLVLTTTESIVGCGASGTSSQCTTGKWITASTRVKANGVPVILADSQGLCPPAGKLLVAATQARVRAS